MKPLLLSLGGLCLAAGLSAQKPPVEKPPVDTTTFRHWPGVADPALSPNGAYALYSIRDPYVDRNRSSRRTTLIVQALDGNWKREIPEAGQAVFTKDSRRVLTRTALHDTLYLLTLGRSSSEAIPHVGSFELFRQGKAEWLAYRVTAPDRSLVLRDLASGAQHVFPHVREYVRSADGRTVVLTAAAAQDTMRQSVSWIRVADGRRTVLWEGATAGDLVLDSAGIQLAFTVGDTAGGRAEKAVWYYRRGMAAARPLVPKHSAGLDNVRLDGLARFSRDGRRLFGRVVELGGRRPKPEAPKLNIWSYTDAKLQSEQLFDLRHAAPESYEAVIPLEGRPHVIRLRQAGEHTVLATDEYVMLESDSGRGNDAEWNWNVTSQPGRPSFYRVSATDGQRRELQLSFLRPSPYRYSGELSPGGKYLVGRDAADVYAYDIAAGVNRNLTQALPIPVRDPEQRERGFPFRPLLIAGWLAEDAALLVYDRFDLWQVDPAGRTPPINLTNGYGRRHNVVFRLPRAPGRKPIFTGVSKNAGLILSAFSRTTKDAGFYRITLGRPRDPERLAMGPCYYGPGYNPEWQGATLVKARDADVYLVHRESASESPNYFWTTDFRRFTPISAVYPERAYNWLTSELVTFKTLDGRLEQGALYKPENFDSTKRYPVIFNYYARQTHRLNEYRRPTGVDYGNINTSWFASHGYVIFTPDIRFTIGQTGESIVNSVMGAAEHLAKLPWVDAEHMGLQGHSFGGYATNYLVTHSQRFAAALSSAGFANLISSYGDTWFGGQGWAEYLELRRVGMAATPWEEPERYIANSPIFAADKVTTPVLLVHSPTDGNVRFHHGLAFFLALRRLGKRAWLLEYEDGGHDPGWHNGVDYTRRITQFFDHYLKGAPAPTWMTRGIPATMRGIDDGFALDEEIPTPGPGLLVEPGVSAAATSARHAPTAP